MTSNMIDAVAQREFHDAGWVDRLLHRFAHYYFEALGKYDSMPSEIPSVWRIAFDVTAKPDTVALQRLFLGVNAHINYDLVLTLVDVLEDEWANLDADSRNIRYRDHSHVNAVIARSIDEVQDDILEKETPALDIIDKGLGRLDEFLIARLITRWRDQVWKNAVRMMDAPSVRERTREEVERKASHKATTLADRRWYLKIRDLV